MHVPNEVAAIPVGHWQDDGDDGQLPPETFERAYPRLVAGDGIQLLVDQASSGVRLQALARYRDHRPISDGGQRAASDL